MKMKFPQSIAELIQKKKDTREYFFSLIPDRDSVSVAVWYIDRDQVPRIISSLFAPVLEDTWDARIKVIDTLLSQAEDKARVEKAITKTVFGLPGIYVTSDGGIDPTIRPFLKKLSTILELTPVGYVSTHQAFAHKITSDEGVPASAILLGVSGESVCLALYRVGHLVYSEVLAGDDIVGLVETSLKARQEEGVLPSRMLIYGGNTKHIELIRGKLLKHAWPTKTNFLHFPKIEVIAQESVLHGVSLAGAAELANSLGEDQQEIGAQDEGGETVVAQPVAHKSQGSKEHTDDQIEEDVQTNEGQDEYIEENTQEQDEVGNTEDEIANVQLVTPESLGFQNGDALKDSFRAEKSEVNTPIGGKTFALQVYGRKIIAGLRLLKVPNISFRGGAKLIFIGGAIVIAFLAYGLYYTLPHATVTIYIAPVSFSENKEITIDADATEVDLDSFTIPGVTIEKSVSGEKTIQVTGKKKIGDPAKGSITLYNKVTSEKNLAKGTIVNAKGLAFTLDTSVEVASASESIGSITFGKTDVTVTASAIGAEGNLPAETEFSVKDQPTSAISARNTAAFSGGSSRDVTVVTRKDYDNLTKLLTDELLEKAKEELASDSTQGRLIDGTTSTKVAEKTFDKELDQEATQLHGSMTVDVAGIVLPDKDVSAMLKTVIEEKIPQGYVIDETQDVLKTNNAIVKKDGDIAIDATFTAIAVPQIDTLMLQEKLAGKNITDAQALLREVQGVAGAEFRFQLAPSKSKLPINKKNISITIAVQQ